ncbi:MAG TPA: hypothetical protein PKH32_03700, partial [Verrucomicrobiota bacterium]|nr:hypothetical protein [Verrucomicrobiota bacterium]
GVPLISGCAWAACSRNVNSPMVVSVRIVSPQCCGAAASYQSVKRFETDFGSLMPSLGKKGCGKCKILA